MNLERGETATLRRRTLSSRERWCPSTCTPPRLWVLGQVPMTWETVPLSWPCLFCYFHRTFYVNVSSISLFYVNLLIFYLHLSYFSYILLPKSIIIKYVWVIGKKFWISWFCAMYNGCLPSCCLKCWLILVQFMTESSVYGLLFASFQGMSQKESSRSAMMYIQSWGQACGICLCSAAWSPFVSPLNNNPVRWGFSGGNRSKSPL